MELGIYRHFKCGDLYQVVGLATHSETQQEMVIYKGLHDPENRTWVRPREMFEESVDTEDRGVVKRFQMLAERKTTSVPGRPS